MTSATTPPTLDLAERERLDTLIAELGAGEPNWAATGVAARADLLRAVRETVSASAADWAITASRMKGVAPGSQLEGEEWQSGPYGVLTGLDVLITTLDRLAAGDSPLKGERTGETAGRLTVRATPRSLAEAILFNGFRADVWIEEGVTLEQERAAAGLGSRHPEQTQGVGLVLGAGNITSIPALDVLYELIAGNRLSLLKVNPVMNDMAPVFARAFAPLIQADALRIVTGAGDVGGYLTTHPDIAHVHITGSILTHDAIVYGTGEDGAARRAANDPIMTKPITSELGGVSPIIVVPGKWSDADLRFQARHVATMRLHNGGYNCIAGQTVIMSSDWPQHDAFINELRTAMDAAPARPPWYPGSDDRVSAVVDQYPQAERLGPSGGRVLVDAGTGSDAGYIETTECFAPVLGIVEVPGLGADFFAAAVNTANNAFAGTLGINVIVAPATRRELGSAFDDGIAELHYGAIAINAWTGVAFLTAAAPWGAYPGNALNNVGSGIGVVHNGLLLDRTEKTVLRGPFRPFPASVMHGEFSLFPTPPWFVSSRSAAETGRRLVAYVQKPSLGRLIRVFAAAFKA